MSTITASMVNELRAKTGLGMMECKKMLSETGGDIEKAIQEFRKKGVKTSITERVASEGRVLVATAPDRKTGAAVEILCNTDFTAKSDPVARILETAAARLLASPGLDVSGDPQVREQLTSVAQQTGENVQLGRALAVACPDGIVGKFLYTVTGKIGVLVAVAGSADEDLIRNVCLHIVAARPLALRREEVPADLVAKEREIAIEQAKATGKPQQIAEKIAEGKLNAFFAERVLLDQEFVRADVFKGSVGAMLKGKGGTLERYVRLEVGQG